MSLREDVEKVQDKIEKTSVAMELLEYSKEQNKQLERNNKRMFIVWIITFIGLIISLGYIVYLLNDITEIDDSSIDIEDVETIDNSHIKIGDDIWEKYE